MVDGGRDENEDRFRGERHENREKRLRSAAVGKSVGGGPRHHVAMFRLAPPALDDPPPAEWRRPEETLPDNKVKPQHHLSTWRNPICV